MTYPHRICRRPPRPHIKRELESSDERARAVAPHRCLGNAIGLIVKGDKDFRRDGVAPRQGIRHRRALLERRKAIMSKARPRGVSRKLERSSPWATARGGGGGSLVTQI